MFSCLYSLSLNHTNDLCRSLYHRLILSQWYKFNLSINQIFQRSIVNRPALGVFPSADWPEKLRNVLLPVAPRGMTHVATMMCGSCSIENAYKAAFMWFRTKQRGGVVDFTPEELSSCMLNSPPGSPELAIMSFEVTLLHRFYFGTL